MNLDFASELPPSAQALLAAIGLLYAATGQLNYGGLALAASNPEGGQAGLLNPARWQSTEETTEISETTPSATESEVMETPTEEQPQYTEQPTDTTNQQTYEQTPQSESSQQQPDSSTQEQSTADNTQPSQ